MSVGPSAGYIAAVDFRLANNPPKYPDDPVLQNILTENWQTLQAMVQAFITQCGISQRVSSQWTQLEGSPSSVVSQNAGRYYDIAIEAISYGAPIHITSTGIQNANATDGTKPADGYCSTLAGIANGTVGEVILHSGTITGLVGLVKGTRYFLSTTGGTFQTAKPVASGNIEQYCGFAISTTCLFFTSNYWIQH